jgi:hypothetical protein
MTKAEFTSYVIRRVGGIGQGMKFHPAFVEAAIERGFNQIIYETFRKDLAFLSFFAKRYSAVAISGVSGAYYSVLPAPIIQLPDYASGVRRINMSTNGSVATGDRITQLGTLNTSTGGVFKPVSEEEMERFAESEAFAVTGDIPYIVRQNKTTTPTSLYGVVEYASWFTPATLFVDMSLVVPYRSYADTDQVHVPSGQDERLMEVVINFLMGTPNQDLKNDNANQ